MDSTAGVVTREVPSPHDNILADPEPSTVASPDRDPEREMAARSRTILKMLFDGENILEDPVVLADPLGAMEVVIDLDHRIVGRRMGNYGRAEIKEAAFRNNSIVWSYVTWHTFVESGLEMSPKIDDEISSFVRRVRRRDRYWPRSQVALEVLEDWASSRRSSD